MTPTAPATFDVYIPARADGATPPSHSFVGDPGRYEVVPVRGDTLERSAWNAWSGQVTGCTGDTNCSRGWMTDFGVWSPGLVGVLASNAGRYRTKEAALSGARSVEFELARQALVVLFIDDSYADNVGGVTLRVTRSRPAD